MNTKPRSKPPLPAFSPSASPPPSCAARSRRRTARKSATASPRAARTTAARRSTRAPAQGAKTDNDPAEWKYVAKGTCEKMGGKTMAPK